MIFNLIADSDSSKVHKNVKKKNVDCFEATLLATNNERIRRPKKVYCYVSPKQLTVKEFYLKVIPKRLHTFRVCPATKVSSQISALHDIKTYQFSNLRIVLSSFIRMLWVHFIACLKNVLVFQKDFWFFCNVYLKFAWVVWGREEILNARYYRNQKQTYRNFRPIIRTADNPQVIKKDIKSFWVQPYKPHLRIIRGIAAA